MKVWKLRKPIDGNFKQLIFKMIFDGVLDGDVTPESSEACKDFFIAALKGFDYLEKVELLKTHNPTLNWDTEVTFRMPGQYGNYIQKNIEITIEGGFEINGDIEFRINAQTGLLIAIGWEEMPY